jgi:hypothetical protein
MDILGSLRNISIAAAITLLSVATAHAGSVGSTACQVGKYTGNSLVLLDQNENGAWDGATDILHGLAQVFPRGVALVGDWDGDGADDMGKVDLTVSGFFLDLNGNKSWDQPAGGDLQSTFAAFANSDGQSIPISGDWNMDGADEVGWYVPADDLFVLDVDGDGVWNPANDATAVVGPSRATGIPIIGDWNGDGRDAVGKVIDSVYYVDLDGDRAWTGADRATTFAGFATVFEPVIGNFDGDANRSDEIGKYVPGSGGDDLFLLDSTSDGIYTGGVDTLSAVAQVFGPGIPLICDFNDDGTDDIGKTTGAASQFCNSGQCYFLDANGNGVWDGFTVDIGSTFAAFTDPGDTLSEPITGHWSGGGN